MRDAKNLPLVDVGMRDVGVIRCVVKVACEIRDDSKGFNADNSLQGKVGLIGKRASEVIRRDLVGGDQSLLYKVLCPLLQEVVMLHEIRDIFVCLCICKSHDEHIAAFFQRLRLIISEGVACGIRIGGTQVMHTVLVWILAGFLVFEERVQK